MHYPSYLQYICIHHQIIPQNTVHADHEEAVKHVLFKMKTVGFNA
jgi:hypothetical protein